MNVKELVIDKWIVASSSEVQAVHKRWSMFMFMYVCVLEALQLRLCRDPDCAILTRGRDSLHVPAKRLIPRFAISLHADVFRDLCQLKRLVHGLCVVVYMSP